MQQQPQKKDAAPGGHAIPGDVLYFSHPEHGVLSGPVAGAGKDGVLIKHEKSKDPDGHIRVPWADVLGHKERHIRKLRVLERGEDGGIAEDEHGQRVYIAGELPKDEQPLNKALVPEDGGQPAADPGALTLRDRAVIDAALIGSGLFVPTLEYIQATYGLHWRMRDPAPAQGGT